MIFNDANTARLARGQTFAKMNVPVFGVHVYAFSSIYACFQKKKKKIAVFDIRKKETSISLINRPETTKKSQQPERSSRSGPAASAGEVAAPAAESCPGRLPPARAGPRSANLRKIQKNQQATKTQASTHTQKRQLGKAEEGHPVNKRSKAAQTWPAKPGSGPPSGGWALSSSGGCRQSLGLHGLS